MINICNYGCEQEAKFQLKNGKWCCSEHWSKCLGYRQKLSILRKGKPSPHKGKKRLYSEDARYRMGNSTRGKLVWNSGMKNCFNVETIEKMKTSHKGLTPWNKGIKGVFKHTNEFKEKQRQRMLNGGSTNANKNNHVRPCREETKIKISLANKGKKCPEKLKEINRKRLLDGGSLKMIKAIKKISYEEVKLRNLVKELYPDCEFQYPVLRYSLDVAIIDNKIAIEYDGYYHFDTEEHKQYHKQRQEKIESQGWKFYRVTMFDKFPTLEEVKQKIEILIKG